MPAQLILAAGDNLPGVVTMLTTIGALEPVVLRFMCGGVDFAEFLTAGGDGVEANADGDGVGDVSGDPSGLRGVSRDSNGLGGAKLSPTVSLSSSPSEHRSSQTDKGEQGSEVDDGGKAATGPYDGEQLPSTHPFLCMCDCTWSSL